LFKAKLLSCSAFILPTSQQQQQQQQRRHVLSNQAEHFQHD